MIKFSLYENAITSINHGIDHLVYAVENDSKDDYKQSILSTFQGVELLMKELLYRIDPIYVFDKNTLFDRCKNPMKPTIEELYNCKSIEINKLCKEILLFYPEYFDKSSMNIIKEMAKERNKIQHFCINIDKLYTKNIIFKLCKNVIYVSMRILGKEISIKNQLQAISKRIDCIFCISELAEQEMKILEIDKKDFTIGSCFECGNHSLFIIYDNSGYPNKTYCTSCNFKRENIEVDDYRICPECGVNSLIYDEESDGGLCLWYRCANHKYGGIIIDMDYCNVCSDYKIEGECNCK
jgi:predicted RNA-binding Zn-ribbon protein involved in translation (DUF1610 family)